MIPEQLLKSCVSLSSLTGQKTWTMIKYFKDNHPSNQLVPLSEEMPVIISSNEMDEYVDWKI